MPQGPVSSWTHADVAQWAEVNKLGAQKSAFTALTGKVSRSHTRQAMHPCSAAPRISNACARAEMNAEKLVNVGLSVVGEAALNSSPALPCPLPLQDVLALDLTDLETRFKGKGVPRNVQDAVNGLRDKAGLGPVQVTSPRGLTSNSSLSALRPS